MVSYFKSLSAQKTDLHQENLKKITEQLKVNIEEENEDDIPKAKVSFFDAIQDIKNQSTVTTHKARL